MTTKKTLGFLALLISVSFMGDSQALGSKKALPIPETKEQKAAKEKDKQRCARNCEQSRERAPDVKQGRKVYDMCIKNCKEKYPN